MLMDSDAEADGGFCGLKLPAPSCLECACMDVADVLCIVSTDGLAGYWLIVSLAGQVPNNMII